MSYSSFHVKQSKEFCIPFFLTLYVVHAALAFNEINSIIFLLWNLIKSSNIFETQCLMLLIPSNRNPIRLESSPGSFCMVFMFRLFWFYFILWIVIPFFLVVKPHINYGNFISDYQDPSTSYSLKIWQKSDIKIHFVSNKWISRF